MKKGICQLSFPETMSVRQCLELARDAGFDGVELAPAEGHSRAGESPTSVTGKLGLDTYRNDDFNLESSDEELRAIGALASEIGVEIPSVLAVQSFVYPLTVADEAERARNIEFLRKTVWAAHLVGAGSVLVIPGVVTEADSYDDVYRRSQDSLRQLAPYAEELRVHLAVEDVWNRFLLSPLEMARFVDEINSPFVGVHFDVANCLPFGYPQHWIRILNKRLRKIHFKDFLVDVGNIFGFVPLLHGDVNWPEVMKAIKEIGYDGYVITEVVPPPRFNPESAVYETAHALDSILNTWG